MSTITIKGFIVAKMKLDEWEQGFPEVVNGVRYIFDTHEFNSELYKAICPYELKFDLPAGWNPTEMQIAALQAEDAELTKQYLTRKNLIAEQISKLQALTYEVA